MNDAEIYIYSMDDLIPPPLEYLHLNVPPVPSVNHASEVFEMVNSSTALTVAQVCSRNINVTDGSTLLEPLRLALLPLPGVYGMRNAVSSTPLTYPRDPGLVSSFNTVLIYYVS